eukprot:9158367-Lingulodinium_polyedra.AAC.1
MRCLTNARARNAEVEAVLAARRRGQNINGDRGAQTRQRQGRNRNGHGCGVADADADSNAGSGCH